MLRKYLAEEDINSITAKIAEVENQTSGEIRVSVRHRRQWRERKLSLHELALAEFTRLGMHQTRDRTGVLILLLMSERKFHIIADGGIHAKVEEGTWDRVAAHMSSQFKEGKFARGICDAVEAVGTELKTHFPRKHDDRNELSNEVVEE
ncbi:MAG TPA: TPM domain-containing protein [Bacteroidota bacterium]|nr:TPM domain-containing protein [Bacteroidota bacterium]